MGLRNEACEVRAKAAPAWLLVFVLGSHQHPGFSWLPWESRPGLPLCSSLCVKQEGYLIRRQWAGQEISLQLIAPNA